MWCRRHPLHMHERWVCGWLISHGGPYTLLPTQSRIFQIRHFFKSRRWSFRLTTFLRNTNLAVIQIKLISTEKYLRLLQITDLYLILLSGIRFRYGIKFLIKIVMWIIRKPVWWKPLLPYSSKDLGFSKTILSVQSIYPGFEKNDGSELSDSASNTLLSYTTFLQEYSDCADVGAYPW